MADSARLVADLIVDRLRAWRVPRVFGYPGDAVAGIVAALCRAGDDPGFVRVRHEEAAGFMATGHAKFTGGVGVCLANDGPGAIRLLPGLYDAKLDGQPVVAIVGEQALAPLGSAYRQGIEPARLFADACGQFLRSARTAEQVPILVDRAFRVAVATRSPTCVVVPDTLQSQTVSDPFPSYGGSGAMAPGLPPARVVPHDSDLNAAAQVIGAGRRVAILVGQGASGAAPEILELADRVEAGVATSLLGKPVLDERLPFHTGVMGHLGGAASTQLMAGCDTLVLIGTNDPWTDFYPMPGQANAVQIDIDGRKLATRYPVEVPLVGDAAGTLRALLPLVPERRNRDWRDLVEASVDRWRAEAVCRTEEPAEPVNPRRVLYELSPRMPLDASVTVDVGSVTYWYAQHLQLPVGVRAQVCGTLAAMGTALPYAVAAKLAAPDRPVIALTGDGAMQMDGLAELVTIADRWSEWSDPRLVVLVLNNRDRAGRIGAGPPSWDPARSQRTGPGAPLPDVPYAGWARLLGLHGIRVDRPELVGAAWDEALAADRPTVVEAVVDPSVALHPPELPFAHLRGAPAAPAEPGDRAMRDALLRERVTATEDLS
ncbi:thiamine pyrophosphate-binding protein [Plantactinospora sp. KBS50]|uniref:thiamine pyrophosphate-binding protein n=1 Tax=Plantactinospora sp. KBS50 TaxID=2024580 RepID=UPI000BAAA142|nr:thiamine pyrophosphate-binding protein [Plantactinospora sp. KBS50]ASW55011.1 thiamine pyrophosphate-binding protein [Plantactinospora sp. KBS50]